MQQSTTPTDTPLSKSSHTVSRRHLTTARTVLLHKFYATKRYPTARERQQLFQQLTALPGCEWYSEKNLSNWFSSSRRRENQLKEEQLANTAKCTSLKQLVRDNPDPTMSMVRIWAKQLEMNPLDICGYLLSENAYWTSGHESHGCASTSNYSLSLEPEEYSLPVVSYSGICGDSPPAWYPLVKQLEEAIFSCPPPEVVIQQHLRANSFLPDIIPGAGPETCTPRDLLHVERQLNQYGEQCTIMRMEQGSSNAYWQWNAIDSENHTIHEHI